MGTVLTVLAVVYIVHTIFPVLAQVPQEDWFGFSEVDTEKDKMAPRENDETHEKDTDSVAVVAIGDDEGVSEGWEQEVEVSPEPVVPQTASVAGVAAPMISIDAIGTMRNGSFVSTNTIESGDTAAVRVLVQNTGTAATGDWLIGFSLPGGGYMQSDLESRLMPGERAYVVVHFNATEGAHRVPIAFVSSQGTGSVSTAIAAISVD